MFEFQILLLSNIFMTSPIYEFRELLTDHEFVKKVKYSSLIFSFEYQSPQQGHPILSWGK